MKNMEIKQEKEEEEDIDVAKLWAECEHETHGLPEYKEYIMERKHNK